MSFLKIKIHNKKTVIKLFETIHVNTEFESGNIKSYKELNWFEKLLYKLTFKAWIDVECNPQFQNGFSVMRFITVYELDVYKTIIIQKSSIISVEESSPKKRTTDTPYILKVITSNPYRTFDVYKNVCWYKFVEENSI